MCIIEQWQRVYPDGAVAWKEKITPCIRGTLSAPCSSPNNRIITGNTEYMNSMNPNISSSLQTGEGKETARKENVGLEWSWFKMRPKMTTKRASSVPPSSSWMPAQPAYQHAQPFNTQPIYPPPQPAPPGQQIPIPPRLQQQTPTPPRWQQQPPRLPAPQAPRPTIIPIKPPHRRADSGYASYPTPPHRPQRRDSSSSASSHAPRVIIRQPHDGLRRPDPAAVAFRIHQRATASGAPTSESPTVRTLTQRLRETEDRLAQARQAFANEREQRHLDRLRAEVARLRERRDELRREEVERDRFAQGRAERMVRDARRGRPLLEHPHPPPGRGLRREGRDVGARDLEDRAGRDRDGLGRGRSATRGAAFSRDPVGRSGSRGRRAGHPSGDSRGRPLVDALRRPVVYATRGVSEVRRARRRPDGVVYDDERRGGLGRW